MGDRASAAAAAWLASFDDDDAPRVVIVEHIDIDEYDEDGARLDCEECNCADADCTCPERREP